MNVLTSKIKRVAISVAPITVIVLVMHFTLTPLPQDLLISFLLGAVLILVGLSIFLFGIDLGITPLGKHIGETVSQSNKVVFLAAVGIILGFLISIAEPDLRILAGKVADITGNSISRVSILIVVSVGIGVMLTLGLLRIVYNLSVRMIFLILYGLVFILSVILPEMTSVNTSRVFLAISFDASGATTGALAVPFVIALEIGVSAMKRDGIASEGDSFGLVGIASVGAIIGVLLLGLIKGTGDITGALEEHIIESAGLIRTIARHFLTICKDTLIAIVPLAVVFIIFQRKFLHLQRRQVRRISKGLIYTFIGLVLFLTGVNAGFMEAGSVLGAKTAQLGSNFIIVVIGFIIGFVTILAEPAVLVMTQQIEEVTSGYVKKRVVFGALTVGVGTAVALSMVRIIVPQLQLWHILLPGFAISIALSFFVKKMFVGFAFDSGGVSSGAMTTTFILAFSQGVASVTSNADMLTNAFGMISLVAMTPIITIQIMGLIFQIQTKKAGKNGGET